MGMDNNVVLDTDKYPEAVMYARSHNSLAETESFLDSIDGDLMKRTFEAIHLDYLEGRYKSHEDVMSEIMKQRGWK